MPDIIEELLRSTILQTVLNIDPLDDLEKEQLTFVQNWICSGAPLFRVAKPDVPDTHLVSYFVIVDPATLAILLVDHKKAGLWLPTGGHVEAGELPEQAVQREIQEELGITATFLFEEPLFLTVTKTVGLTAGHTDVSLWYVLQADQNSPMTFDRDEFHAIYWFQPDDLPYDHSDPQMRRFISKLMKKLPVTTT
jgi:8-oxo-dGTP pyrophosphatase MutT (NUDIX family)